MEELHHWGFWLRPAPLCLVVRLLLVVVVVVASSQPAISGNVCLPACLPACLSACLPACLSACLPVCLPACLSVRASSSIYFHLFVHQGLLFPPVKVSAGAFLPFLLFFFFSPFRFCLTVSTASPPSAPSPLRPPPILF